MTLSHSVQRRERLHALDVFRGLTVAAMLLVNQPGNWSAIYPPLAHAPWHGWTPTDLIFPFFLFIVGVTTHLSMEARRRRGDTEAELVRQIVRRSVLIVLAGLLLASFPWWPIERITGMRFPGVLQRIGVAYLAGALLTLRGSVRRQVLILAGLLYGYWFAMTLLPVPGRGGLGYLLLDDPSASLAAWLDRAIFQSHLWPASVTWDPEGLLSTVPAVGTVMLGVFAGRWIGSEPPLADRLVGLFGAGALGMVLGLMWDWSFPINKQLWTSSYVLFTGGMAATVLATCIWMIDVRGFTRWTTPFAWYGRNPMIAFLGSGAMSRTIYSLIQIPHDGGTASLQQVIHGAAYASWLGPRDASLAFAVSFVLLWAVILGVLDARGIVLRF
ncbi:MAG TPA: heparan-alpha-glucosaminide N-acetyltransferase domain-containing protein [Gemmatimonadaceae bacterium]